MEPFDESSKAYDTWYHTKMGTYVDQVQTDLVFNLFPTEKGMKVLDVGCGTGNQSIKLARRGLHVIGVDRSTKMLDIARKKGREEGLLNVDFLRMDGENLEFDDETFDGALSVAAFEFLHDPEKVLGEMIRVVKRGGTVVVGTINRESSWGELYCSEEYRQGSVFKHASLKSIEDIKHWYPEKLKQIDQCLFIPPHTHEEEISFEREKELAENEKFSEPMKGGFVCAVWVK